MRLPAHGIAAIREYGRRHPIQKPTAEAAQRAAETIRSWFYPKQRAFYCKTPGVPRSRWRATCKTRRAGATAGGVRELIASALDTPGFRATYVSKTSVDARDRAWTNDNKSGFLDVVRALGTPVKLKRKKLEALEIGGVTIEVRDGAMKLDFSNGSQLEVFGANNIGRQASKRGAAKHVFWIDEAQDFPHLDEFMEVISAAMRDFGGECWLTGTPGVDCAGLFYEVTKEESPGDERPPGWEVHTIAVVDNPYFGHVVTETTADGELAYYVDDNLADDTRLSVEERALHRHGPYADLEEAERAATEVRWDMTAGAEKREKNLKGDEPGFVREWLGRWVKTDARYVYPVHAVPKHQLLFAPQRLADNPFVGSDPRFDGHPPWYDHHAAVRDLPRIGSDRRPHKWLYSLWFDFGYHPDPFACVMWAFTPTLNDVYEMFSWKQTEVHADDQARYIKLLWDVDPAIVSFGGDAAGKQADFAEWARRLNLPLEEANKAGKNTLEELLAGDVRRGLVHLRAGSPLYTEMRHLVYLPTAPGKPRQVHKHRAVGGVVHGDHCCLIAGTMVETARGPVAIEDVRIGDQAWTRAAARPVTAAFSVGIRSTWRVDFDNGASLVGTSDHPIWTARGWIPLAELMPGDTLTGWVSTALLRPSPLKESATGGIPVLCIEPLASTSCEPSSAADAATPSRSIARSGKASTARCQMDSTSIIATITRSTTTLETSSSCPDPNTSAIMPASQSALSGPASISPRRSPPPRHGTDQTLVERGTPPTGVPSRQHAPYSPPSASTAEASFRPRTPTPGSAPTPASRPRGVPAELTTSRDPALAAEARSWPTDSPGSAAAPIRVLRVYATGRDERVFNLTVAGEHEYFANGVLVSNCDAGRYGFAALTHYLSKVGGERPAPGTRAAFIAEESKIERDLDQREAAREKQLEEADELAEEYGRSGEYEWQ